MKSKAGQFRTVGLWVVGVLVAATLASTWLALRQLERQTRASVGGLLDGVVETSRSSMLLWYQLQGMRSKRLARDSSVAATVRRLMASRGPGGESERAQAIATLDGIVGRLRDPELRSYEVIGGDSVVMAASSDSRVGRRSEVAAEYPEVIALAFQDSLVIVPPGKGRDVVSIAIKLQGLSVNGRGAVLVLQYDADGTFSQVLVRGQPGRTGEAYAVDRTGTLLTTSRFLSDLQKAGVVPAGATARRRIRVVQPGADLMEGGRAAADLSSAPLTTMAAAVAAGRSGQDIDGYPDYRGVRVLGAWVWDPILQLGIAAEMDEMEALAGYRDSRRVVLGALIGLAALIGVLVLALVSFGSRAGRRLREARDEWEEVANARLTHIAESEKQYRDLFEDSADGMLISIDGRYVACNRSLVTLFGYDSVDEVLKLPLGSLSPDRQPDGQSSIEIVRDRVGQALDGKSSEIRDWTCRRKDGTSFEVEARSRQVTFDGKPAALIAVRDIGAMRLAERAATQYAAVLETKNAELNRSQVALAASRDAAEEATRTKSTFLANMSHEIRTPMNAILGYAQILRRDDRLASDVREKVETIHRSGAHLLTIINDVLEMSKIEAGRAVLSPTVFDPAAILRDAQLMFEQQATARGLGFHVAEPVNWPASVRGDAGKVRQVVLNLMSNAIKFTERGSVLLRPGAPIRRSDTVRLEIVVEDTGPGVDPAKVDRIFEPFDQGGSTTRAGGTGLGLAISRSFARMMGGELTVRSRPGAGSTFMFSFECELSDVAPAAPVSRIFPTRIAPAHSGLTVLVVDDIATNRDLLRELLSRLDFIVRVADSGETALEIAHAWHPRLILMDLRMPGMGGIEAIRRLRASGETSTIIAITASVLLTQEPEVRAAGADGFMRKPYDETELFALIAQLLDIEYEYPAVDVAPSPGVAIGPADFRALPSDLLEEIRTAALQARHQQLHVLAERVAVTSPDAAAQLRQWTDAFSYTAVIDAMGPEN